MKKKALMVLAALLVVLTTLAIYASRQISATQGERVLALPGDDLIPQPLGSVNHAITIRRPPHEVWRWLAQMGSGRAGWYAYDFIDNGGQRSAEGILPNYQDIGVGSVLPALPGATDVFVSRSARPRASFSRGDCPRQVSDQLGIRPGTTPTQPNALDRARPRGAWLSSLPACHNGSPYQPAAWRISSCNASNSWESPVGPRGMSIVETTLSKKRVSPRLHDSRLYNDNHWIMEEWPVLRPQSVHLPRRRRTTPYKYREQRLRVRI